ncbi:hypothetical protein L798_13384 [Zootermopsis nevadensis]|uniref:Uncharacterized protein n=1 Tax=Zootermopsis nevadensis TaxID=136037 RepID=A0A067QRJ5_ZOONE|nr:hypothetical protein L798_13384 [Zootermopsis nevadensis]
MGFLREPVDMSERVLWPRRGLCSGCELQIAFLQDDQVRAQKRCSSLQRGLQGLPASTAL